MYSEGRTKYCIICSDNEQSTVFSSDCQDAFKIFIYTDLAPDRNKSMPPTPEHGLGRPGCYIWDLPKKPLTRKEIRRQTFPTLRLKQEYWVLSIFFAAAVPSCNIIASHSVWTRCPDWNHGQGGNMRSPLKPPSYNPCHPWDDFMRSRETMGNLHVPVLGWVWRMRTVCSNDSEQSLYHATLLACFACVPNAESTNDMAHMQQSFFVLRNSDLVRGQ